MKILLLITLMTISSFSFGNIECSIDINHSIVKIDDSEENKEVEAKSGNGNKIIISVSPFNVDAHFVSATIKTKDGKSISTSSRVNKYHPLDLSLDEGPASHDETNGFKLVGARDLTIVKCIEDSEI